MIVIEFLILDRARRRCRFHTLIHMTVRAREEQFLSTRHDWSLGIATGVWSLRYSRGRRQRQGCPTGTQPEVEPASGSCSPRNMLRR